MATDVIWVRSRMSLMASPITTKKLRSRRMVSDMSDTSSNPRALASRIVVSCFRKIGDIVSSDFRFLAFISLSVLSLDIYI